jgi:hypothetical protein
MTKRTLETVTDEMDAKVMELGQLALALKDVIAEGKALVPARTQLILNPNIENMLNNITMPGMGFVAPSIPS